MFPNFRIISDGPLSGSDTFISTASFYSSQWGANESPSELPSETAGESPFVGQNLLLPEQSGAEPFEVPDTETTDEMDATE